MWSSYTRSIHLLSEGRSFEAWYVSFSFWDCRIAWMQILARWLHDAWTCFRFSARKWSKVHQHRSSDLSAGLMFDVVMTSRWSTPGRRWWFLRVRARFAWALKSGTIVWERAEHQLARIGIIGAGRSGSSVRSQVNWFAFHSNVSMLG